MNVFIKSTLAAVMAASTLFPMVAGAASGTVKITGTVFAATCQLSNSNIQVNMGRVNATSLNAANQYYPAGSGSNGKDLTIKLTNCPLHTEATVKFKSNDVAPGNPALFAVRNSTDAIRDDLAIALYEANGSTVISKNANAIKKTIETTNVDLNYKVFYKSLKAVVGEQANATINFEITYS